MKPFSSKNDNSVSSTTEDIIKAFTQKTFHSVFFFPIIIVCRSRTIISKALYIPPFVSLEQIENCCQHLSMLVHCHYVLMDRLKELLKG